MKESYNKGVTNHVGHESCLDDPRGRGEALTVENTGVLLSCEITAFREPRQWPGSEGNRVSRESIVSGGLSRRSHRTWHVWTLCTRESGDLGKEPLGG